MSSIVCKGLHPQSLVGIVAGIVMFGMCFILFARWGEGFDRGNTLALVTCGLYLIILVPLIFIGELFSRSDSPLGNIAATLTGVLYVAYPVSFLLFIPLMLGGGEWRPLVFLMYLFITWANDEALPARWASVHWEHTLPTAAMPCGSALRPRHR